MPSTKRLLSIDEGGDCLCWSLAGEPEQRWRAQTSAEAIRALSQAPVDDEGTLIALGGDDGLVTILDAETGSTKRAIDLSPSLITALALEPGAGTIAVGTFKGEVYFGHPDDPTLTLIREPAGWESPIEALRYSPQGRLWLMTGHAVYPPLEPESQELPPHPSWPPLGMSVGDFTFSLDEATVIVSDSLGLSPRQPPKLDPTVDPYINFSQ